MWYRFPSPIVMHVSGKDAVRYLNARLTNDVRSLTPGAILWGAALTAQGRVEGVFCLHALADAAFLLVCDGGETDQVHAAFRRYIVADRVVVKDVSTDWGLAHVADRGPSETQSMASLCAGVITSSVKRLEKPGFDLVYPIQEETPLLARLSESFGSELSVDEYTLGRVRAGFPSYPQEVNEDVVLTECGMREMVSFSKGCYVGQEVIERTDAIGKVPRKLERVSIEAVASISAGTTVQSAVGAEIGKVVTVAADPSSSQTLCFALLRNGRYASGDTVIVGSDRGEIL
jgi:folate-binding protein YgfZ